MAFEYGCFVSYAHPEGGLMKTFIKDLIVALESELDPYLRNQVYFDEERLKGGHELEGALGHGLCASACWVMVYVPQYKNQEYCLREFRAMQMLQEQRREALGGKLAKYRSMIVPILVRGSQAELPDNLSKTKCIEFDQLTLAEATISDRPEAMQQIRDLAGEIHEVYKLGEELEHDCEGFELPQLDGDLGFKPIPPRFPGDAGAPPEGGGDQ